jgi:hypothetical protein
MCSLLPWTLASPSFRTILINISGCCIVSINLMFAHLVASDIMCHIFLCFALYPSLKHDRNYFG